MKSEASANVAIDSALYTPRKYFASTKKGPAVVWRIALKGNSDRQRLGVTRTPASVRFIQNCEESSIISNAGTAVFSRAQIPLKRLRLGRFPADRTASSSMFIRLISSFSFCMVDRSHKMLALSWLPAGAAELCCLPSTRTSTGRSKTASSVHRPDKANLLSVNFRCIVGATARELPKFFVNYRQ